MARHTRLVADAVQKRVYVHREGDNIDLHHCRFSRWHSRVIIVTVSSVLNG